MDHPSHEKTFNDITTVLPGSVKVSFCFFYTCELTGQIHEFPGKETTSQSDDAVMITKIFSYFCRLFEHHDVVLFLSGKEQNFDWFVFMEEKREFRRIFKVLH